MKRRLACLLATCLVLAACGSSKTEEAPESAATAPENRPPHRITADWGRTKVAEGRGPAGTVFTATEGVVPVETTYGGRYVSSLAGEAGNGEREWLFWMNGIESDLGAADIEAGPDDRVWWDLHVWGGRTHVPAIVGQWPAPMTRALDAPVEDATADPAAAEALAAAGVEVASPAAASGPRTVVGESAALAERDPTWAKALADPAKAGLTAWFEDGEIVVWDAEAGEAVPVPKATAVMVATTEDFSSRGAPVVIIAGRTAAAAEAAAAALADNPLLPQRHFAICLDEAALIVCSGGQGLTL
jgi:hypothetical protein